MKTVKTLPEFAAVSELEVNAALDAYDDSMEEEHSSCGGCEASEDAPASPVVAEVFRLITAYTDRMNELIVNAKEQNKEISESFLADLLSFGRYHADHLRCEQALGLVGRGNVNISGGAIDHGEITFQRIDHSLLLSKL